ncbi:uncharacterized protein LOC110974529 [Acanthaster planci]|uniref:Glycosyltransferase family 92 protein n=1 Tax=Acanthaster planci TaxID=133434 RepID=A0A8B7XM98_ACAPL|nr:uncharacterized protein LOC110974529 [Acanthaster planci]
MPTHSFRRSLEMFSSMILIFQMFAVFYYTIQTETRNLWRKERNGSDSSPRLYDPSCYLELKLEKSSMPIIHSVFADPISHEVVAVGVRFWFENWHEDSFFCEFRGPKGRVLIRVADPILKDYQRFGARAQYVFVLTCPVPEPLYGMQKLTLALRRASNTSLAYENITVCHSQPREGKKRFLSMCTMLKDMDVAVPKWLDYHRYLGVEHVYIYDNSNTSTLHQTVRQYVDSGFLTIIPWAHAYSPGKTYLEVQIAHENDCLWRNRHWADWMIKIDVDEFLQPMDPSVPLITDILRKYNEFMKSIGSLRVQNWFFCRGWNQTRISNQTQHHHESVFERNQFRSRKPTPVNTGRDKAVVRPINVHFFKIHGVKLGGDTITLSPQTEMRMVHYRGDNRLHSGFRCSDKQPTKDSSMCRLWAKMQGFEMTGHQRAMELNCL